MINFLGILILVYPVTKNINISILNLQKKNIKNNKDKQRQEHLMSLTGFKTRKSGKRIDDIKQVDDAYAVWIKELKILIHEYNLFKTLYN